jgi:DNA-binding NarL/FixJ family response regulator
MTANPRQRVTEASPNCRHGHPFPENAARDSRGWLYCRECNRIRARRPAAEPDEVAIERAAAGDPPERLTPRERRAAIARLDRQQLSSAVIAERVRCSRRTVHRARSEEAA